jgi:ferric iron reductase protein FhuF
VREALVSASEIGPYFAVESAVAQGEWRTVADLWTGTGCLSERVNTAREYLGSRTNTEVDLRASASISSLGFLSRLVSPALATACLAGVIPRLDPHHIYWRPVVGGPVPIAFDAIDGITVSTTAEAAAELERMALLPCVLPVLTAYSRQFRLSLRVLRGNVASALAGAAGMLIQARTPLVVDPVAVVQATLALPSLTDTGHYERPFDDRAQRFFVRHNCCLFYRVPGGGTCGDCVLVPDNKRLEMWRATVAPAGDD